MTARQTHDYTSELELKSLLIRIKNDRLDVGECKFNDRINARIKKHLLLNELDLCSELSPQRNNTRRRIYKNVVKLSELVKVDSPSYERFGEVILLMIQRILTRPNFSGYSYRHDFYSDAVYKIIKYLHNFNHKLISKRSGQPVNAFAYISQYIHNSVIYIIGRHKKDNDSINDLVRSKNTQKSPYVRSADIGTNGYYNEDLIESEDGETIDLIITIEDSLTEEIKGILQYIEDEQEELLNHVNSVFEEDDITEIDRYNIIYPNDYLISFDEYNIMREFLTSNISIIRAEPELTEVIND